VNTEILEGNVKSRHAAAFYLKISWKSFTSSLNRNFTKNKHIAPRILTTIRDTMNKAIKPRNMQNPS